MQLAIAETKEVSCESKEKTSTDKYSEAVTIVGKRCAEFYAQNYEIFNMFCCCFGKESLLRLIRVEGIMEALKTITTKEIPQWVID